jgi:hypothetical protein
MVKNGINWANGCPLGIKGQVSRLTDMFVHIDLPTGYLGDEVEGNKWVTGDWGWYTGRVMTHGLQVRIVGSDVSGRKWYGNPVWQFTQRGGGVGR